MCFKIKILNCEKVFLIFSYKNLLALAIKVTNDKEENKKKLKRE